MFEQHISNQRHADKTMRAFISFGRDSVYLNAQLRKGGARFCFYYDRDSNTIGIKPVPDNAPGLTASLYGHVSFCSFSKQFGLHLVSGVRYPAEWSEEDGMWLVRLEK